MVAVVVAAVGGVDISWKAAALAAGHGAAALDAPSSILRPLATVLVGLAALAGALVLPALCLPGAYLVVAGVSSNIASLVLWRAVPNPLGLHLAGDPPLQPGRRVRQRRRPLVPHGGAVDDLADA